MRLTVIFAASLLVAGVASAQTVVQLQSTRTPEERAAAFDAADANKDGKLDLAEFSRAMDPAIVAQLPEGVLGQLKVQRDTNQDGYVSRTEFLAKGKVQIHP